jgi:hypothetical protein
MRTMMRRFPRMDKVHGQEQNVEKVLVLSPDGKAQE